MGDSTAVTRGAKVLVQVAAVGVAWLAGEGFVRLTHVPLSGGIVGMLGLLGLLLTGHVKLPAVKRGADWLLADMSLFFVPALLAILEHRELFGLFALKMLLVIVGSTLAVMLSTAITVELFVRARPK